MKTPATHFDKYYYQIFGNRVRDLFINFSLSIFEICINNMMFIFI